MLQFLRKHPFVILSTVIVLGLLVWGFWPQPVLVEVVPVTREPLTVSINEEGRTRVIDRYVIAAPVDGVACRIQLKVGDRIKQGQVLLNISPLESQVLDPRSRAEARARESVAAAALRAAKEAARAADAAAAFARSEITRIRPLTEKGLLSKAALDKANMDVNMTAAEKRSAHFKVDVAQYELEAARSVLHYSTAIAAGDTAERVPVRAPITGRILKVPNECEGPVKTGTPLLEVGDTTRLEVEVDVLSADAVKIKPGMQVLFDRWGGTGKLKGVVRNIEPVGFTKISALGVEEQRVYVIADFTSPAELWQRLGDGYRVDAQFVLWHGDDVLQVPAGSLFRYQDGWAVFVVNGNRASLRKVTVGQRNGLRAQILDGLKQGDRVVNHPSDDVDDGVRIQEEK